MDVSSPDYSLLSLSKTNTALAQCLARGPSTVAALPPPLEYGVLQQPNFFFQFLHKFHIDHLSCTSHGARREAQMNLKHQFFIWGVNTTKPPLYSKNVNNAIKEKNRFWTTTRGGVTEARQEGSDAPGKAGWTVFWPGTKSTMAFSLGTEGWACWVHSASSKPSWLAF